jgi:hypothetical protein
MSGDDKLVVLRRACKDHDPKLPAKTLDAILATKIGAVREAWARSGAERRGTHDRHFLWHGLRDNPTGGEEDRQAMTDPRIEAWLDEILPELRLALEPEALAADG